MEDKINKNNEYIDYIELIEIVFKNKFKILLMSLIGVVIGIFYTFYQTPKFNTTFMIVIGHPALLQSELLRSPALNKLLNDSSLDDEKLPNFSLNKKNKIFKIISEQENIRPIVNKVFEEIIFEIIENKKEFNQDKTLLEKKIILNISELNDYSFLTNEQINQIKIEDVIKSLNISYGKTKQISPAPFKHGFFGLVLSLIILLFFTASQIVLRTIKMNFK